MERCFVIQPFDNDKFDNRFEDVFKPAIEKAGFEAYRIDKDLAVTIPIEDIERGIAESAICFAEISIDNPNVWYELGYAFACGKQVVMVCSEDRPKFPFDIQHKLIIKYKTGSKRDFEQLEVKIHQKFEAIKSKLSTIGQLNKTPVQQTEGLDSHEIALMILILENSVGMDEKVSTYILDSEMNKAGYTLVASKMALRTLEKKNMIVVTREVDWNGNEYFAAGLTYKGDEWFIANKEILKFRKDPPEIFDF